MKAALIIVIIQYTIYFTFESIIFRSVHHRCSKDYITAKRKIRKIQASKYRSSRGVVDHSEVGDSTFVIHLFYDHQDTSEL